MKSSSISSILVQYNKLRSDDNAPHTSPSLYDDCTLHQSAIAAVSSLSSLFHSQQKQLEALKQLLHFQLNGDDAETEQFYCWHNSLLNSTASLHLLQSHLLTLIQTIIEHDSILIPAFTHSPPDWSGLQASLSDMEAEMFKLAEGMLTLLSKWLRSFTIRPYKHNRLPRLSHLTTASLQSCEGLLYSAMRLPLVTEKLQSISNARFTDSNRAFLLNASAAIIQIEPLVISLWLQHQNSSFPLQHRKLLKRLKQLLSTELAHQASTLNESAAPLAQRPWLNSSTALNKHSPFKSLLKRSDSHVFSWHTEY